MLAELLPYYEEELIHLRKLSREFGERYPRIAGRLLLEGDTTADPHVERLIEAFAFIAARIHKRLDDDFPEITDALLGILYPHYLRPIPSMSIVQFQVDAEETALTTCYEIRRHTQISSPAVNGVHCRFRTCYPVELWPLKVTEARLEPIERTPFSRSIDEAAAVIHIRLKCIGEATFAKLGVKGLRFFLDGESPIVHALYEVLFKCATGVRLIGENGHTLSLPPISIQPVGFAQDEGMLEYDARSFLGYRLLHEYFAFPDKFLFFDITNLGAALSGCDKEVEIVVPLKEFEPADRLPRLAQAINLHTFKLACTPVVNLFQQRADPIGLTHQKWEYQIVPDRRRAHGLEVYSVDSVYKLRRTGPQEEIVEYQPFYSHRHAFSEYVEKTFWYAVRRPSTVRGDDGSDMYLSLVDLDFNPAVPAQETISVATTCTNRDLPGLLPFGTEQGDFSMEEGASLVKRIRTLRKPTPTVRPPLKHGARWRLISHLSLNHLSIVEGGREALVEILSLYDFGDNAAVRKQITGISDVSSAAALDRLGTGSRSAFVRGTDVTLDLDETAYAGTGVYLFGCVLERFIGLYCSVNSFTRLTMKTKQRERVLATWPPRAGNAILL